MIRKVNRTRSDLLRQSPVFLSFSILSFFALSIRVPVFQYHKRHAFGTALNGCDKEVHRNCWWKEREGIVTIEHRWAFFIFLFFEIAEQNVCKNKKR